MMYGNSHLQAFTDADIDLIADEKIDQSNSEVFKMPENQMDSSSLSDHSTKMPATRLNLMSSTHY
jgi:hypothetical protein